MLKYVLEEDAKGSGVQGRSALNAKLSASSPGKKVQACCLSLIAISGSLHPATAQFEKELLSHDAPAPSKLKNLCYCN